MNGQETKSDFGKVKDVCVRLNMSRTALYGIMDRGELSYTKFGRSRRIRWSEVERYIERQTVAVR